MTSYIISVLLFSLSNVWHYLNILRIIVKNKRVIILSGFFLYFKTIVQSIYVQKLNHLCIENKSFKSCWLAFVCTFYYLLSPSVSIEYQDKISLQQRREPCFLSYFIFLPSLKLHKLLLSIHIIPNYIFTYTSSWDEFY